MRICRDCNKDESEVRFYDKLSVSGIAAGSCCQPCWVKRSVEWRNNNRDRWNSKRHRTLTKNAYGITDEEYDSMYLNARCAGCGVAYSRKGRRLVVDHDHKTGKIRGLLCHECNRTIATAKDDPQILRSLASYLEVHSG